jgi:caffeoyl-CoA O-methyltransferase
MDRAAAEGLPRIEVGPETGNLLALLTRLTQAKLVIEVGTLAAYSAIWIARALAPTGRLITIEVSAAHAAIAQRNITGAGLADRATIRQGRGCEVLPKLLAEFGPANADLILLDAERSEYLTMLPTIRSLLRPAGVLVIDNCLAAKRWVSDPYAPGEAPDVMDTVNRTIASDPAFSATLLPVGNGVLIAVRS